MDIIYNSSPESLNYICALKAKLPPNKDIKLNDTDLISKYIETNDLSHIGELYKKYIPMVLGISMNFMKEKELAEDNVSEIFEILIKDLKKYQVTHFKSWLYMVVQNHCRMKLNKEKVLDKKKEFFIQSSENFMESEVVIHPIENNKEDQLTKLEECIKQLKEEQKICVDLFYIKEMCYQEIEKTTGYVLSKVKSYIQNGKRNLKICIESKSGPITKHI